MIQLRVYPTRNAVARAAAAQFVSASERAMTTRGRFVIALSGGSTPLDMFRLLVDEYTTAVEWVHTQVFWGDERCVPSNDPENNAHNARLALLDHVPIPINNIHRVQTELSPEDAADDYEHTLRDYFESRGMSEPRFDLLLLGMGSEGHTASLFPGSEALHEEERWVVPTYVEKLDSWRVTLTPVALNAATKVVFLVAGDEKAPALAQVLGETKQPDLYPAQIIDPPRGDVLWIADEAAASQL